MRIAICDDEREEIVKIQNMIAGIQGNYQVDTYHSGRALLEAAADAKYDKGTRGGGLLHSGAALSGQAGPAGGCGGNLR